MYHFESADALTEVVMSKNLKKIRALALLGETLCSCHKCGDVKMFFRVINELVNEDVSLERSGDVSFQTSECYRREV